MRWCNVFCLAGTTHQQVSGEFKCTLTKPQECIQRPPQVFIKISEFIYTLGSKRIPNLWVGKAGAYALSGGNWVWQELMLYTHGQS